jgi:hypothetical protein
MAYSPAHTRHLNHANLIWAPHVFTMLKEPCIHVLLHLLMHTPSIPWLTIFYMRLQCKEPSKALPIGIVGSLVVVTTFYILASLTLTLMVPVEAIDASAGGRCNP